MQRLNNSGGAKGMNLKKGDFLIFDEAGVGISSRDWYSIQNKLLGCVLQTFRNMNIGVIFTTPNLSFIDIQARKLFHYYLETDHIDFKRELAYLRTYELQHNSLLGKDYHKHPVCLDEHNRVITIQSIAVPKPRPDLIKEYEDAKTEFTKKLNEKVLNELKNPMASKMNEKMATVKEIERIRVEDFNKQVEVIKKDLDSYMSVNKRGNKGLDACKIQGKLNVVPSKARAIRDYILSNS